MFKCGSEVGLLGCFSVFGLISSGWWECGIRRHILSTEAPQAFLSIKDGELISQLKKRFFENLSTTQIVQTYIDSGDSMCFFFLFLQVWLLVTVPEKTSHINSSANTKVCQTSYWREFFFFFFSKFPCACHFSLSLRSPDCKSPVIH